MRTSLRDHPRIRGEHGLLGPDVSSGQGSSPHTRGAQSAARPEGRFHGIIPAYAGSTRIPDPRRSQGPGSSPHTRGAPTWTSFGGASVWDHPRIRGEHFMNVRNAAPSPGSSPHTRGAHERHVVIYECGRIIPAYAGSTQRAPDLHGPGPGSSPHTRGAHPRPHPIRHPARIIPAYAGSTRSPSSKPHGKADHPRIRGEHRYGAVRSSLQGGSSPHTRGAPVGDEDEPSADGIIPAYAGSTRTRRRG